MSGNYPSSDPGASGPHADWYSANVAASQLTVQRCQNCDEARLPARYMCAACQSMQLEFQPASGEGALVSWTTAQRALHPGFFEVVPYTVAVVALAEGPTISCVLRDVDATSLAPGDACSLGVDDFGVPFAKPS